MSLASQCIPVPPRVQDLTGREFGRLKVIGFADRLKSKTRWLCECSCGNVKIIRGETLTKPEGTESCGCLWGEAIKAAVTKHGAARAGQKTRTYRIWMGMNYRCRKATNETYGGAGVKVCGRWEKFENFLADMGEAKAGDSIERKDPFGDYEPTNCVWLPRHRQNRNKRKTQRYTYQGKTLSAKEWSEETGIAYSVLYTRLTSFGMTIEAAITSPLKKYGIRTAAERKLQRKCKDSVNNAKKAGRIQQPSCCQAPGCTRTTGLQAHHWWGYSDETALSVVFLCTTCHTQAERGLLQFPEGQPVPVPVLPRSARGQAISDSKRRPAPVS